MICGFVSGSGTSGVRWVEMCGMGARKLHTVFWAHTLYQTTRTDIVAVASTV